MSGRVPRLTTTTTASTTAATTTDEAAALTGGRLRLTVLSAYDLPDREPPLYIRLDIGGNNNEHDNDNKPNSSHRVVMAPTTVHTGPPVQRHKDRNSFKFHSHHHNRQAASSGGELIVDTPTLAELYRETAVLTVVYSNPRKTPYTASYPLHQLLIHETTWLILNLVPVVDANPEQTTSSSSSMTTTTTRTTTTPATAAAAAPPKQPPQQEATTGAGGAGGSTTMHVYDDDEEVPPTLRLQMTLQGPYRPEVAALVNIVQAWFAVVDHVEAKVLQPLLGPLMPTSPLPPWLLIPTAPIIAVAAVCTPLIVGVLLVTLPLVLPLLVLGVICGTALSGVAVVLYGSTQAGRQHLAAWLHPLQHALLHTPTGQAWVYPTGPRPTPVHYLRHGGVLPESAWGQLVVSLWLDFLGSATYLLPLVGEGLDVAWAPLQTAVLLALYSHEDDDQLSTSLALPLLSFVEEILPLTDLVPTATLAWLSQVAWPLVLEQLSSQKEEDRGAAAGVVTTTAKKDSSTTPTANQ